VLISRTVKDLVAASGTRFEDFGAHVLKRHCHVATHLRSLWWPGSRRE
jgi:hypothetical protein